ncbi:MAG: hypothetical protein FIO03_03670 [Nitrosopumilales archaeon]|nr:hypothetical protein [Nitrosopumilales archaeon]
MVDIWYMHMVVDGITMKINYTHSSVQKNIIERVTKYVTDGTENLDDYYPCIKGELPHVYKWLRLFVFMHNLRISHFKFSLLTRIM